MVVHSTLFTIHGKVMGKNDLNSQETYICYYQGLNLNWFSDVDIVQWSQEYHNNSVLTYLSQDHEELEALLPNHFLIGRNFYNDCVVNDNCNKVLCNIKKWRQVHRSFLEMLVAWVFAVLIKVDSTEGKN